MSQGPNTFPYFSPTVPFGVYITNLNGPSLVLTPPALVNNPFQIIKTTANTNKMIISNSVETTTFGLDANGDARWSSTGKQFINGDRLQMDTIDGIFVNTTTGVPFTINGNAVDTSFSVLKTANDVNDIVVGNPAGFMALGVTATGATHLDTTLGTTVLSTTIGAVPFKVLGNIGNPMALEISKTSANTNYTLTGNTLGYTTYGVNAVGETDILSSLKTNINTPSVGINTVNGVKISAPSLNTDFPLEVQGGGVLDETVVVSKPYASKNLVNIKNTLGSLALGVDSVGRGIITTPLGITMTNTTGNSLQIVPPAVEPYPFQMNKATADINKMYLSNSNGTMQVGMEANGNYIIAGNKESAISSTKLFINSSGPTKLQINGFPAGTLLSDVSGNISVGSQVPPSVNKYVGGGVPLNVVYPANPNARYHRVTLVGGGGGGGNRTGNCTGGGGGGGASLVVFVKGNQEYSFIVGTLGPGAPVPGGNSDGFAGGNTLMAATPYTGLLTVGGGGGGGYAAAGGAIGFGGLGGTAVANVGTFDWLISSDLLLGYQSGGDGMAGNNSYQTGVNGGGTLICPAGGGSQFGLNSFNAPEGSGRGGGGGAQVSAGGGIGASGSVTIETFY